MPYMWCFSCLLHLSMNKFTKLWAAALATLTIACTSMKNKDVVDAHSEQVVHTLLTQERQKAILEDLKSKAMYDESINESIIFEDMPNDPEVRYVAAKNRYYFGNDKVVFTQIRDNQESVLGNLKKQRYSVIGKRDWTKDVYIVQVEWNILEFKNHLQGVQWIAGVTYDREWYSETCVTWNDPEATNTRWWWYWQAHLSSVDWAAAWFNNVPTHAADSVDVLKPMHQTISTLTNPNIVVDVIDGWIPVTNSEFNVLNAYNFVTNTTGNTSDNHGTGIAALIWAKSNNGVWWRWISAWIPINTLDVWWWWTITISALYAALDRIKQQMIDNPNQVHVLNMSFNCGNDVIVQNKLAEIDAIKVASAWNTWSSTMSYPAQWNTTDSGIIPVGWTMAEDPNKPQWSWSNTGPWLVFMSDAGNIRTMTTTGAYTNSNWTSWSAAIVSWTIADLYTADINATIPQMKNYLYEGAHTLSSGKKWVRTASSDKYIVMKDVPTSIDAAGNGSYTYNFTPNLYNTPTSSVVQTLNRKCYYPNNTLVPMTTNPNGTVTFNVVVNTNNGFSATNPAVNRLRYEFTPSNATSCVTTIKSKPITITNLGTLSTQEVDLLQGHFYPNPVQDKLIITNVSELWLDDAKVTIGDISGRTVHMTTLNSIGGDNAAIDMSQFAAGTYFVQFHPKDAAIRPKTIKVIKK